MNNIQQLEADLQAARLKLENVPQNLRASFVAVDALRRFVAEESRAVLFDLTTSHPRAIPGDPNSDAHVFRGAVSGRVEKMAALKAAFEVAESAPEHGEAQATVAPLLAAIARIEAELREAIAERDAAEHARRDALEAAKAEAIAALEAEFAKPESTPAPEPPRPFRGRGLKPSVEAVEEQPDLEPRFT